MFLLFRARPGVSISFWAEMGASDETDIVET
jgi:hypothetical protein